ncbi:phosphotransferase [Arthrobacter sp. B1805]|uniref:phosphotransferase n=1 Tax=Arthrobacter sp. B1805 TaxID=2058892 RepID=UPI000CE36354|nr:phosphotransferase [Arthrobacter sp. B1805]
MKRTPMELAAIASAAVPGLAPTGVAGAPDDAADFDSALLVDDAGKQWRVRSPKHAEASMRLETELQALRAFTPAVKAELPFLIPHMAGSVRQGELSTFVYSHLAGATRTLDALTSGGRTMAQELGRVLAAIHELPKEMVQRADLPSYEANEYRQRKLNELDQAATTGKIPPILLRRWEHALEDVALWRFGPTVVHGDLHEDHLLIAAGRVSAVTGWTDLSIGDPAEDFAWLAAAEDTTFVDAVHAAYAEARASAVDPHLARRAALAAEFALAQWLVRGVALADASMIHEAEGMLATLAADVESIEQEQHEAAERDRRAHEERVEWGDAMGTDSADGDFDDDFNEDFNDHFDDLDDPDTQHGVNRGDGPARSGSSSVPADEETRDAGSDASDSDPARAPEADPRARTGSHSYGTDTPTGRDRRQQPGAATGHDERPGEEHVLRGGDVEEPTGPSAAYERLKAGRQQSSSSKVTLLRSSGAGSGSPDDVATSAMPIVSFGS